MAEPKADPDTATQYRDLPRGVAVGTVVAVTAVAAWGMLAQATIQSGNFAVADTPGGPGLVIWPLLIALIGFTLGWLGTILVLERRRPNPFASGASWIGVVLLAGAIGIGFIVASWAGAPAVAIYLLGGGDWLWVDIPAGDAQFVVVWLAALGVAFVMEHAVTGFVLSTRATRRAGIGESGRTQDETKGLT